MPAKHAGHNNKQYQYSDAQVQVVFLQYKAYGRKHHPDDRCSYQQYNAGLYNGPATPGKNTVDDAARAVHKIGYAFESAVINMALAMPVQVKRPSNKDHAHGY